MLWYTGHTPASPRKGEVVIEEVKTKKDMKTKSNTASEFQHDNIQVSYEARLPGSECG